MLTVVVAATLTVEAAWAVGTNTANVTPMASSTASTALFAPSDSKADIEPDLSRSRPYFVPGHAGL
jgi:hypothetical protein